MYVFMQAFSIVVAGLSLLLNMVSYFHKDPVDYISPQFTYNYLRELRSVLLFISKNNANSKFYLFHDNDVKNSTNIAVFQDHKKRWHRFHQYVTDRDISYIYIYPFVSPFLTYNSIKSYNYITELDLEFDAHGAFVIWDWL